MLISLGNIQKQLVVPHVVKHLSKYSYVSFTAQDRDVLTPGGLFHAVLSEAGLTLFDLKVWETLLSAFAHPRVDGREATGRY